MTRRIDVESHLVNSSNFFDRISLANTYRFFGIREFKEQMDRVIVTPDMTRISRQR